MARQPRRSSRSTRGYDRTDRLNELLRRILAEELEHIDDDRLILATITGVVTDRDLSQAKVYVLGNVEDDDLLKAFEDHRKQLQRAIGTQTRLRRVPPLLFTTDEVSRSAGRIETILREINDAADEQD
ncbi:MAG TPA: 30S ribosome-binding factor RbfA [Acidimicrobiia bacterium]|jgi:ribosome-binding factor A|nr:30S ribosome-binding factor RbfA [Acidimicrobiia bacterium]HIL46432.1 30S ribosome-binding factor RbfA [Acidimicrobiia bacterium]